MILIAANQDTVFGRLAATMGQPELGADERYATHSARGANQVELDEIVAAWTRTRTGAELEQLMADNGIPAGKIYRAPEMLEDAHFQAREAIVKTLHPVFGETRMQNVAPKLSATPGAVRTPGPELGQHNAEIYGEILGMSTRHMAELSDRGII